MSSQARLPALRNGSGTQSGAIYPHAKKRWGSEFPIHLTARSVEEENAHRQAEFFYLQKQIQSQTAMVIVLEDGEHIEGCIDWYDLNSLKVRGRTKTLVYKTAIKYMYKLGEVGQ